MNSNINTEENLQESNLLKTTLISSEHGFDDYDVQGIPTVRRVTIGHGIRKGGSFNVYCDDSRKIGGVWQGTLERSLAYLKDRLATEAAAVRNGELPEPQAEKGYRVHLYAVVRVPVDVPSAASQLDAIATAEEAVDLNQDFKRGEYADEIVGVLVDEVGDQEYLNTRNYVVGKDSGEWEEDHPASDSGRKADPEGSQLFFKELWDSVEALTAVGDQYGARTLADLMYLQNAIATGGYIEHAADDSAVTAVIKQMASADRWMKYVEVAALEHEPSTPSFSM